MPAEDGSSKEYKIEISKQGRSYKESKNLMEPEQLINSDNLHQFTLQIYKEDKCDDSSTTEQGKPTDKISKARERYTQNPISIIGLNHDFFPNKKEQLIEGGRMKK